MTLWEWSLLAGISFFIEFVWVIAAWLRRFSMTFMCKKNVNLPFYYSPLPWSYDFMQQPRFPSPPNGFSFCEIMRQHRFRVLRLHVLRSGKQWQRAADNNFSHFSTNFPGPGVKKKLVPGIAKNLSINIFGQNSTLPLESWKFSKKYFQNSKNFLIEKMEEPEFTKDPGITEPLDDHLGTFYL